MYRMRFRKSLVLASTLALAVLSLPVVAQAQQAGHMGAAGHAFAARGQVFRSLPREAVPIRYRGGSYYYRGGEWYRRGGFGFVVIAPPFGAVVPFLPGFYTTLWFGGIPYYYANDVYYTWQPDAGGYVVTRPPTELQPSSQPPASASSTEPFIYPKNGQSEAQQATDRYECHHWATTQASFDPTLASGTATTQQVATGREAYIRAFTACLEGRGYSVK